jgi:hypothetical protein
MCCLAYAINTIKEGDGLEILQYFYKKENFHFFQRVTFLVLTGDNWW